MLVIVTYLSHGHTTVTSCCLLNVGRVGSTLWKLLWLCFKQVLVVCPSLFRGKSPVGICCACLAIEAVSWTDCLKYVGKTWTAFKNYNAWPWPLMGRGCAVLRLIVLWPWPQWLFLWRHCSLVRSSFCRQGTHYIFMKSLFCARIVEAIRLMNPFCWVWIKPQIRVNWYLM